MMPTEGLPYDELKQAFKNCSLFKDKVWRLSPEPWMLDERQVDSIRRIGQACLEFYRAQEQLYRYASEGRNLLRNAELKAPWVVEYLDKGKPEGVVSHARHPLLKRSHPVVIRPDLLQTENGFALTEIDAVPGGVGLTSFLNRLYADGFPDTIGAGDSMPQAFYETVAATAPDLDNPVIAIVVSDEAETYRPEFEWLSRELRQRGRSVYCLHPDEVMPLGQTLCAPLDGNPVKIDIIYRFFELFDLRHVSTADMIMNAVEAGEVALTPPMKPFQEEKMSLALFHHHLLEPFWRENLSRGSYKVLKRVVPKTWIIDPVDLPPNAVLDAPFIGGKPISRWEQLAEASQRERNLIIKASGFDELAWGGRSVVFGSDVSKDNWQEAVENAIKNSDKLLYVLQEYHKPLRLSHPVYEENGEIRSMHGRVRLCPYYTVDGDDADLVGVLATFCPADKKIIHGMRDAAMLPCRLAPRSE